MPTAVAASDSQSPAPMKTRQGAGRARSFRYRGNAIAHHRRSTLDASPAGSARCTFVVSGTTRPVPDLFAALIPNTSRHVYCGRQPVTGGLHAARGRGVMGEKIRRLHEGADHAM